MSQKPPEFHYDLDQWLKHHHQVQNEGDTKGKEISVFAVEHGSVYDELGASDLRLFDVAFYLGPLCIRILIEFDLTNKTFSVTVYGKLPFLPEFKIASGCADLDDGLLFIIDLIIIDGKFRFYIKDGWLWLHYDVTVLGKYKYKNDIKLIPVPTTSTSSDDGTSTPSDDGN